MERLNLRKDTLVISKRRRFYKVLSFNDNDIILGYLHDGEILSIKCLLSGNSPSSDEIYRLFLFNFRPLVYQVGDMLKIKNSDSTFEVVNVGLNNRNLVLEGLVHITKNGGVTVKQLSLTYQQLMRYET